LVNAPAIAVAAPLPIEFPTRPIRVVVPFPAGGPADLAGRLIAEELTSNLKQGCVIENVGGAGGAVGTEQVGRAEADGYTLLVGSSSTQVLNGLLRPKPSFNPAFVFAPVGMIAEVPLVIVVRADGPIKTLQDILQQLERDPTGQNYGSAGAGSISHLTTEYLLRTANRKAEHVPYRGSAPAVMSVIAGDTLFFIDALAGVTGQIGSTLRAVAVTSSARSSLLPEVPTVAESGFPGFESSTWYGLFAPRETPEPVQQKIRSALVAGLRKLVDERRVRALGMTLKPELTPADIQQFVEAETGKWKPIVAAANVTP